MPSTVRGPSATQSRIKVVPRDRSILSYRIQRKLDGGSNTPVNDLPQLARDLFRIISLPDIAPVDNTLRARINRTPRRVQHGTGRLRLGAAQD